MKSRENFPYKGKAIRFSWYNLWQAAPLKLKIFYEKSIWQKSKHKYSKYNFIFNGTLEKEEPCGTAVAGSLIFVIDKEGSKRYKKWYRKHIGSGVPLSWGVRNDNLAEIAIETFYKSELASGKPQKDIGYVHTDFFGNKVMILSKGRKSNKLTKTVKSMRLTNLAKKLLDENTRTLIKAGYIDGDLELTDDGQEVLLSILFAEKKEDLVKMAQEEIKDKKK